MTDQADRANEIKIQDRRAPYTLPPRKEGNCQVCGEHSKAIVNGMCVPCREKYKL
jgi:hypothetical protein